MNWLTNYVKPKLRVWGGKNNVPDNLWHQCPACERMIFHRDLDAGQRICPHCRHHFRVSSEHRFQHLLDMDSREPIEMPKVAPDPLKFRDRKRYTERLKEAQNKTKEQDALQAEYGTIVGQPAVLAVMNFDFMAGSMGTGLGEGFIAAADAAIEKDAAFVVVTASGGARMQEGALSLMQMARTVMAVKKVKDAGLPYIVVLTDPTTGGVTASFAMLGDVHIAEPGALIGFAGARVVEQTIRQKLPDGFQRAEFLLEHGMVDMVVQRLQLRSTLGRVLALLRNRFPEPAESRRALPAPGASSATSR